MAKKRSAPAGPRSGRGVTVVGKDDLEMAKEDALLQLKIGRSAHLYAVGISAVLALDGILLLFLYPHLPPLSSDTHGLAALWPSYYLLIPVLAGIAISVTGLVTKWEAFQLWPWEPHFSTTVAAVAANSGLLLVYLLRVLGVTPLGGVSLFPWFYPLSLVGISLGFVGLAMTWSGWDRQQTGAVVTALLPLATPFLLTLRPTPQTTETAATAVSLFLSAILFQMSGSFLHLISSGTPSHEKALISAGQNRIVQLADETRQKEEALRFREAAIVRREADVETAVGSHRRQEIQLAAARQELDQRTTRDRARAEELDRLERELAGRAAEVEGIAKTFEERVKAVELREQEVARQLPQLSAREQRAAQREGEQTRRDTEFQLQKREVDRRAAELTEAEGRLDARKKQLDEKTADLLRREGEVTAKGAGPSPKGTEKGTPAVGSEFQLRQLKSALDEQNATLGRRAREVAEREKAVSDALRQTTERQANLAAREAAISQREAGLTEKLKAADDRRAQYETAAKDYQTRLAELGRQQVEAAQHRSDLERSKKTVDAQQAQLDARETSLRGALSEIDQRERDVLARERTIEAHEAELSLRRQEVDRGDLTLAGLAAVAAAGRDDEPPTRPAARPSRTRPALGDMAPRAPPAVRPATGGDGAEATPPPSERLAQAGTRHYDDRLPTGTARLDDLLLGGLPKKSHVVLLGDAFVGKEVVLYAFVAEGLKRGEPVILVTTSRSPAEISQNLGVVLPQFLEYEQLGMVTWIDASMTGGVPSPRRLVAKGSDDRAGILSALVQAARTVDDEHRGAFRVGFLGLSAVFAHADERASFSFLQNVVGILKPRETLAMYSLEGGALTEAQVESLLGRMDGAIVFRQDRDRTFLSVRGFGDVQTHDWVECRATNRALIVGSFALERIR